MTGTPATLAPEEQRWAAPVAQHPVRAVVRLPGSKSMTARALVLAALADSPGTVRRPLRARDTELMAAALRALGVDVTDDGGDWHVGPAPLHGADLDVGLAGTVMRFLLPVACLAQGEVRLDGDPRARERPLRALTEGLRALGGRVDGDALPLLVHGQGGLRGGDVVLDASESSQFVSALLLAGPRMRDGVVVRHVGGRLPSSPHVAMTLAMLQDAGAGAEQIGGASWRVSPGPLAGREVLIEPDLSNAAPFLAAALVTGGSVTVPEWPALTTQPGDAVRDLLAAMGGTVMLDERGLTVTGHGTLTGLTADLGEVGELTPVLAALAALASTPSRFTGIAHLRGHETDRLAALAHEIHGLGGEVRELADGLDISPRPLHGGVVRAYGDHRMATAAAVLGLAVPGVELDDVATTGKTLPGFERMWAEMLAP